ncbi:stage III sporulation protein AC [Clostridium frigidicarnis]|uniref:Stage III sporulation protein AC n=2 Tax=Clostridium frigidicarnis TaxID=84698 RepID=A0A1I0WGE0_9CLOT|nr:stage III sporulation protein AC [Clostridium frigidicarnis]
MDINILFKIGGLGIILLILEKVLKSSGKDDIATMVNIAGVVIILLMVISMIAKLFDSVKTMFMF